MSDVAESMDASSKGDSLNGLKTFDWPLCVVPMSGDQAKAEQNASLAVDVHEAVLACASGLVTDAAEVDPNADNNVKKERARVALPRIAEILKVRDFKHNVLFPSSP